MITDDERFIKIQRILALSDIQPADCIKINDLIIDLSKQKKHLQSVIDKAIEYIKHYEKIRGYYEYVENGYDEYNYEEDLQEELLEILRSKE